MKYGSLVESSGLCGSFSARALQCAAEQLA